MWTIISMGQNILTNTSTLLSIMPFVPALPLVVTLALRPHVPLKAGSPSQRQHVPLSFLYGKYSSSFYTAVQKHRCSHSHFSMPYCGKWNVLGFLSASAKCPNLLRHRILYEIKIKLFHFLQKYFTFHIPWALGLQSFICYLLWSERVIKLLSPQGDYSPDSIPWLSPKVLTKLNHYLPRNLHVQRDEA